MTSENKISQELTQLAEFAAREDWLYQAERKLAVEISLLAQTFCESNPAAELLCQDYIGDKSFLVYKARCSIIQVIKTIGRSLNQLQGLSPTYHRSDDTPDYLADTNPAQAFLRAEITKRKLDTFCL